MRKEVTLAVAEFLDSPERRRVAATADEVRRVVELFVDACYSVGKVPRLIDGEDVRTILTELLPGHLAKGDALGPVVPEVVEAYLDHVQDSQVVPNAYEVRQALDAALDGFQEVVASGAVAHRYGPGRREPVVHRAPKLGRNDPCSCGSGKKYKKCHGRDA